jgi:tetratricopeptide (TPR) repeat protein
MRTTALMQMSTKIKLGIVIPSEARDLLSRAPSATSREQKRSRSLALLGMTITRGYVADRPLLIGQVTFLALVCFATAMMAGGAGAQTSSSSGATHRKIQVEDDTAGSLIVKAETALDQKNYGAAEPLLKQAIDRDPKDFRPWYDLGFLYGATERLPDSIAAYRKSVALDPQVFESNLNLGLSLAQIHDPEAAKYLRAATGLTPTAKPDEGRERAWLSLGHVLETKDVAAALDAFAQAARLQPTDPEPHLSSAVLLQQDKPDLAEKEYLKAQELDPKSADAAVALANLYQKTDRLPEAETALRRFVGLQPQNAAAYFQLGRILLAEHKRYDAIDAYEAGLKLQPADLDSQVELGLLYTLAGKFDQAESLFRACLAAHPDVALAHAGLGRALLHRHQPADAQSELLTAVKLDPKLADAYADLAFAASENKNYELTIRALDFRGKLTPETPGTYFLRATAYDNLHDRQHAAENYHRFLEVDDGRLPDQEWQAKHRLIALEPKK